MAPLHLGAARTGPATPRPRPRPEASRPASRPVTGSNFPPKVDNKPGSSSGAARAYPETPFVAMVRFDPISAPRTQRPTASDESDSRREIIQDSWLGMLYQRERRENDAAALNLTSRSKPGGSRQYKAVAASGQEFCPKASGHQVPLPGHSEPQRERSPEGEMGIGIETEFLLAARQPLDRRTKLNEFANVVARSHNANVALEHPRMTNDVEKPGARDQFDHWALVVDDSMSTGRSPCKLLLLLSIPGITQVRVADRNLQGGSK